MATGRRQRYRGFTVVGWISIAVAAVVIVVGAVLLLMVVLDQSSQEPTAQAPVASAPPECGSDEWLDLASWSCVPRATCAAQEVYDESTNTCQAPGFGVTSISPSSGLMPGGTDVTIVGSGFQPGATVTIGGNPATAVQVRDAQTIEATAPGSPDAFPVDVVVTNPDGSTATLDNAFVYLPVPIEYITSVVPPTGSTAGGEPVIVKGNDFVEGTAVSFGGAISPSVTLLNENTLRVITPGGSVGQVPVSVTIPGRSPWSLEKAFRYRDQEPRVVTGIRPGVGAESGGTRVVISGSGFRTGAQVLIGGRNATRVQVVSSTRITAVAPRHPLGIVSVAVRNPGMPAAVLTGAFEYVEAPTVTSVEPAEIPVSGQVAITIRGTGFLDGATVTIGGALATRIKVVSQTEITAVAPAGSLGPAAVVVENPGQPAGSLRSAVTYVPDPTPTPSANASTAP